MDLDLKEIMRKASEEDSLRRHQTVSVSTASIGEPVCPICRKKGRKTEDGKEVRLILKRRCSDNSLFYGCPNFQSHGCQCTRSIRSVEEFGSKDGKEASQKSLDFPDSSELCDGCGNPMVIRTVKEGPKKGRKFLGCSTFPKCGFTKELSPTPSKKSADQIKDRKPSDPYRLGICPKCSAPLCRPQGAPKSGIWVECINPKCDYGKGQGCRMRLEEKSQIVLNCPLCGKKLSTKHLQEGPVLACVGEKCIFMMCRPELMPGFNHRHTHPFVLAALENRQRKLEI